MHRFAYIIVVIGMASISPVNAEERTLDSVAWSEPVNGLCARVTFEMERRDNGHDNSVMLIPYLELKNVSDKADPLGVDCGTPQVVFELVDAKGRVVRHGACECEAGGARASIRRRLVGGDASG